MIFPTLKLFKDQLLSSPLTSFIILILSMSVGALEAFSVVTLVPLFEIITNGSIEDLLKYELVNALVTSLGITLSVSGILILFSLFIFLKAIFSLLAMTYIGRVVAQISFNMREQFLDGLIASNWSSLAGKNSGEFINAVNFEIPKAASLYRISCTTLGSFLTIIALFAVLIGLSSAITFGGLILSIIIFIFLNGFVVLANNQSKIQVLVMNKFISRIHELLGSIKVIKAMNLVKFVFPMLISEASELKVTEQRQVVAKHGLTYLREPIVVVVLSFGLYFAINDLLVEAEILFASLFLFFRLSASVGKLQSDYQTFLVNSHFYKSFNDKLQNQNQNREQTARKNDVTFLKNIEYKKVSFSHDSKPLLENINLRFSNKGFIAITGSSGSGKTTLVDMLLGFYQPTSGEILIDDQSLNKFGSQGLRSQIGYVQQDPFIFDDTIVKNVSLGDNNISFDIVIEALKGSNAYEFACHMPNGLQSKLGESGSKISGGQKQRISIARALARKPDILILDEATSALDKTTMLELIEIFKKISSTTLVIAITHQQEIIDASDKTYLIENYQLREL